jgi:hypothetical protein
MDLCQNAGENGGFYITYSEASMRTWLLYDNVMDIEYSVDNESRFVQLEGKLNKHVIN